MSYSRDRGKMGGSERRESGTRRAATPGKPAIVFADDSAVQMLKLTELLEEAGYRAVPCSDGLAAVRSVEAVVPDLILLDLEMPGLGGVDACRTIKENKTLAHIPVLILTAHEEPKYLVAAFDAGCSGYIVKGSPDTLLLQKIARHVLRPAVAIRRAE